LICKKPQARKETKNPAAEKEKTVPDVKEHCLVNHIIV
jgi:hypothetical protein